jgi:hypothetical protein
VVHLYLFAIADPASVRLNWEHGEARWVTPGKLALVYHAP